MNRTADDDQRKVPAIDAVAIAGTRVAVSASFAGSLEVGRYKPRRLGGGRSEVVAQPQIHLKHVHHLLPGQPVKRG
jgi:hypothetical protein